MSNDTTSDYNSMMPKYGPNPVTLEETKEGLRKIMIEMKKRGLDFNTGLPIPKKYRFGDPEPKPDVKSQDSKFEQIKLIVERAMDSKYAYNMSGDALLTWVYHKIMEIENDTN